MIRRLFAATQSTAAAAVLLHAGGACAAGSLQDFPRAGIHAAGGIVLASVGAADGSLPLQLASLDSSSYTAQGSATASSLPGSPTPGTGTEAADRAALPAEGLPLLAGLACIAAFVLGRRTRH